MEKKNEVAEDTFDGAWIENKIWKKYEKKNEPGTNEVAEDTFDGAWRVREACKRGV
jgi:hypothetical protein